MRQLVIGWGNPLAGDDGIGPRAADIISNRVPADVCVLAGSYSGLRLVESMRGYDRVIIADIRIDETDTALRTDVIRPHELEAPTYPLRHDGSLVEFLHVFRVLNDPELPTEVVLVTAPVPVPGEWRDGLSTAGERAAQRLADAVVHELEVTAVV
jgi:hydrogenase maturation protease